MTLRGISFGSIGGYTEIPPEIWGLLSEMEFLPVSVEDAKYGITYPRVEYAEEIIKAALNGRIAMDAQFNLQSYLKKIEENTGKKALKNAQREKHLCFDSDELMTDDGYGVRDMNSVDADAVAYQNYQSMAQSFDSVVSDSDLQFAISTIKALSTDFLITYKVDIPTLMKKALTGVPQAVTTLKQLCTESKLLAEQVKIILTANVSIDDCFA